MVDLLENENHILTCYPNPTSKNVNIVITNLLNEKVVLTLFDQTGRAVKRDVKTGSKNLNFDLSNFENGIYYLNVNFDQQQNTIRIVKN